MKNEPTRATRRRAYDPPTITRVHVDPVNELLMFTAVCYHEGDPSCTNTAC